ncbi:hypothetical protein RhiirA5_351420 [Rhizophagus irregularis]|uniref:Uncharacterized protein n=1 Tax=Rhizophagus irregularis TaxID=588596 RepID=A0A2I1DXG0_9GLOM|nr:hypothetical protein RhiirA5_351420 [Rhizophagus irregularis]PKC70088.1 hypothetical protein RhiirA1_414665 [Rhizophagus irregularis]PKY14563.1 hypothetical protein RhiirB3_400514 [Rhizophagus irregularis]GBC20236.1 hypothetical protein RIR_e71271_A0A2I1DXG0_9GLOM [Rhizophagus irregularis DAOM 181602=DAOM 197198]
MTAHATPIIEFLSVTEQLTDDVMLNLTFTFLILTVAYFIVIKECNNVKNNFVTCNF